MPNILAIDTATNACSAALYTGGDVVTGRHEDMVRGHAERLLPMIDEVMADAGMTSAALELIAVTVGPGAFTGLRVGLAAARGLALARSIPCFGATTTETIAAALHPGGPSAVLIDSKRSDLYVQVFDAQGRPLCQPSAVLPDDLGAFMSGLDMGSEPLTLAGDGVTRARDILAESGFDCLDGRVRYPDAADLARLAAARWRPGQSLAAPAPLYIRPPDAVVPVNGGRLRP